MNTNYLPESLQKIWDWLTFADYDAAKEQGASDVFIRYSRRNISMQAGWVLDEAHLNELSLAGDDAAKELRNMLPVK